MPYKKQCRKPRKKKKCKKPPQATTAVARVGYSSGLNFLPPKFIAKMRWNKSFTLAAGTSDIATIAAFRMAGLWDPEFNSGASLQPYGFDQLATYYSHYLVLGSKATVKFVHTSGNPMVVGCITTRDTNQSEFAQADSFMNDPQSRFKIISNERPHATVTATYSKNKIFGTASDTELTSVPSGDPVNEQYYLSTYVNNVGPVQTQASVVMVVSIDYTVLWTERAAMAKS